MDDILWISKTYRKKKRQQFVPIIYNKLHLVINYRKTKALICNSKKCKQEATEMGGKSINIVHKVKYLGKVLTPDFTFKDHIEENSIFNK